MGSSGLPQAVWWRRCGTCTWWTGMEQRQRRGWHGAIVLSSVAEGVGAEGRWRKWLVWLVLVADGVWASFLHTAGAVRLGKKRWSGGFCGMGRDPPCTRSITAAATPTSSSPQLLPPPAVRPTLALQDLTTATTPPQHHVQDPASSNTPQRTTQYPDRQPTTSTWRTRPRHLQPNTTPPQHATQDSATPLQNSPTIDTSRIANTPCKTPLPLPPQHGMEDPNHQPITTPPQYGTQDPTTTSKRHARPDRPLTQHKTAPKRHAPTTRQLTTMPHQNGVQDPTTTNSPRPSPQRATLRLIRL
ncbi:hypothetical protein H4582DRAFT_2063679 [Lactarius indigo]|nr:hypothetical protein H4582DRAFT_2063679 [Lactarius indigo]